MKKIPFLLLLFVLLSMILSACGSATTPTDSPAVVEPEVEEPVTVEEGDEVEEVVEEPEEVEAEVEEPTEMTPPDLDAAFSDVLSNMSAYNTIDAETLITELVEDAPPFLLDVRTAEEVAENGHIEGAVNVPLEDIAKNLNLLPSFDTPIVTYCGSGWRATIAMTALNALGWNDVRALKVAFTDWKDAGNPVVEGPALEAVALDAFTPDPGLVTAIDSMLSIYGVKPYGVITADELNIALGENPDLQIIDVRRKDEVEEKGYADAPNYIHIPLEEFVTQKENWPVEDAAVAVYCGSGHRSTMALTILGTYGYKNVTSLKGGFAGWVEAGYPVLGGMAPEPEAPDFTAVFSDMLANMEGYNTIDADQLLIEIVEDQPPFLLDVRTTEEVEENGHIEGAAHIPLADLAKNVDLLPGFDTPIVTYCGSGWRATIAMTTLYAMGYTDVRALKVTFADWVDAGNPVVAGLPEPMLLSAVDIPEETLAVVNAAMSTYGVKPYAVITADDFNLGLLEEELIVMDVRRSDEVEEKGVIDVGENEFIHIPLEQLIADLSMWPAAKDAKIYVYCGSGHRSTMATTILGLYGYTNVWSLKGGFAGWEEAGYPVVEFAIP